MDERASLADQVAQALGAAVEGSHVEMRGSIRAGTADTYSDIDMRWNVPDEEFERAVAAVRPRVEAIHPVASLRIDPEFARSQKRRLIYVRFRDLPLFWRLDLDVMAQSIARDDRYDRYDRENVEARDATGWSRHESALMNGIATLKALLRVTTLWQLSCSAARRSAPRLTYRSLQPDTRLPLSQTRLPRKTPRSLP